MSNIERCLGKITSAEFGMLPDYPDTIGLILGFKTTAGCVNGWNRYAVNINPKCRYEEGERSEAIEVMVEMVVTILKEANVNHVSELVGKPVEVIFKSRLVDDFRILTEVL